LDSMDRFVLDTSSQGRSRREQPQPKPRRRGDTHRQEESEYAEVVRS
jgi:hypothetical protein